MPHRTENGPVDRVVLLLLLALLLLVSPLMGWWASAESPWYAPYIAWGVIIGATAWLQHRGSGDGV